MDEVPALEVHLVASVVRLVPDALDHHLEHLDYLAPCHPQLVVAYEVQRVLLLRSKCFSETVVMAG